MAATNTENKSSSSVAAIGFAIFAAILLVAFLSYRGSDVGQLGSLIGNLGGGPLFGSGGFGDSLIGVVIGLVILLSWFGLGSLASSLINIPEFEHNSRSIDIAVNCAIGAAVWSLVWFFLGLAGAYKGGVALAAACIGLALGGLAIWRGRKAVTDPTIDETGKSL